MKNNQILLMFHCQQSTGYAIGVLEKVFFDAAKLAGYTEENIFWSFSRVVNAECNIIECEYKNTAHIKQLEKFLSSHKIVTVLAFDLGYPAPIIGVLKKHKVKIVSYWGASMSSLNSGLKLLIKKLEWFLRKNTPDYFVFESIAMQLTATHGRGVPKGNTEVIALGVDTERFYPAYENYFYAHERLQISKNKKIIFYSGHMEERKGVHIIVHAAVKLFDQDPKLPVHFVICGNKDGEETKFLNMLKDTSAQQHVTFAGYRTDIEHLMRSSCIGVIASTGWDSFTMSSVEMMSSGLPLIVSNLQGLAETIANGVNGFHITPGSSDMLAERILQLCNDDQLRRNFSNQSRERVFNYFSRQIQVELMAKTITKLSGLTNPKPM